MFFYTLFLIYIAFFIFVVANTLTSLFIDAMMVNSTKDRSAVIAAELRSKREYIHQIKKLHQDADSDGSGVLTWDEFYKFFNHPEMIAFVASLDIDMIDASELFRILSNDGTCEVDIETFVLGCVKMKGAARSADVISLQHSV